MFVNNNNNNNLFIWSLFLKSPQAKIALEKNDLYKISKAWDQSLTYVHKKVYLSFTQQ